MSVSPHTCIYIYIPSKTKPNRGELRRPLLQLGPPQNHRLLPPGPAADGGGHCRGTRVFFHIYLQLFVWMERRPRTHSPPTHQKTKHSCKPCKPPPKPTGVKPYSPSSPRATSLRRGSTLGFFPPSALRWCSMTPRHAHMCFCIFGAGDPCACIYSHLPS